MIRDHLRSAIRSLHRHRGHAVINIGGLALGLAATFFILVFIAHETSYDEHHAHADRIYRLAVERVQPNAVIRSAATPRPLAAALEERLPEVERATRVSRERAEQVLVRRGTSSFFEDRFYFADSSVFDVFTIPLVHGNPETALADPFSVVVSTEAAERLFGGADPIGEAITVRLRGDADVFEYRVTGVARDLPETSHFRFDFLAAYEEHPNVGAPDDQDNWAGLNLYTFLLLRPGADPSAVAAKIPSIFRPGLEAQVEENLGISLREFEAAGNRFDYFLQPLTDIHLHSQLRNEIRPNGDIAYVIVFGIVAAFILGLACINFTHIATVRSIARMKEVGVRKVLGARRGELIRQFLVEALSWSLLAAGVAVLIVWAGWPLFERASGRALDVGLLASARLILLMAAAPLVAGIAGGLAPALYVSRLGPSAALRGRAPVHSGASALRGGLVVFQFAVSGALIVCTLIMERQMEYLHEAKLGFEDEHVVVIDGTEVVADRMVAFRERLSAVDGVVGVTNGQSVPGRAVGEMTVRAAERPADALVSVAWLTVGADYAQTLGLEMVSGRDLSSEMASDSTAVLLNASAVSALGFDGAGAVGESIVADGRTYRVVGVVEDYHFASFHRSIDPLVIFGPDPWNHARPNFVVPVRVRPDRLGRTLAGLEKTWNAFVPDQPLVYSFLDEEFGRLYRSEDRTRLLFRVFSLLAIVIACLGLFGLAAFSAQRRTKEIGIRKVLGASMPAMVAALAGRFVVLVMAGLMVAVPVAYAAMRRWLEAFAYSVEPGPGAFVAAAAIVLLIAFATIGFHVVRASLANPVESLKYE